MARIALDNRGQVDVQVLESILEAAHLPPGDVQLIVGDPLLADDFQGMTIPRASVRSAANIYGLEDHLDRNWECGITIGPKWARSHAEFPAYFAYLVGHECGHATTILNAPGLAVYEDLIVSCLPRVVSRRFRWDEFPHEIRYDQFGKAVAEVVCGSQRVAEEFARILQDGFADDEERLRKVLALTPNRQLSGLREELADFTRPHKGDLLAFWQEKRDRGGLSTAAGLPDLEWLWRGSAS